MPPLLVTQSLTHHAKGQPIFSDLAISIHEGDRVALIGPNGAGKSTLLRLFAGEIEPDNGTVTSKRDIKLGFVPQIDKYTGNSTVAKILEESAEKSHIPIAKVSQWLGKGGFPDRNSVAEKLSGGWKKRLSLVSEFVKEPELLLLDEPTNHLDIDGIEWLEELLKNYRETLIVVSHDRYFLENICTKVIEVDDRYPQGILAIDGTYSNFVEKREEYFQARTQYRDSLANKVRRETAWLRAGVKARTTKSKYRQEQAYAITDELKNIKLSRNSVDISYSESNRKTKDLLEAEDISKTLNNQTLFSNLSFKIQLGMRVGIVGANGCGKTTLLKTLLGEIKPDTGKIKKANNIKIGVLEQDRGSLDLKMSLKEALCPHGDSVLFNNQSVHIASWSKRFLYRVEQLSQPVGSLSGGEQARILIARAMCLVADVLVLDEPTNDLDISTLEMLEESLLEFKGAVILISHDRSFLDRVATNVIGFLNDGEVELFADYHQWDEARSEPKVKNFKRDKIIKLSKEENKEVNQIEKQIEKIEKKIINLQLSLSEASMSKDMAKINALSSSIEGEQKSLKELFSRWEELEERR